MSQHVRDLHAQLTHHDAAQCLLAAGRACLQAIRRITDLSQGTVAVLTHESSLAKGNFLVVASTLAARLEPDTRLPAEFQERHRHRVIVGSTLFVSGSPPPQNPAALSSLLLAFDRHALCQRFRQQLNMAVPPVLSGGLEENDVADLCSLPLLKHAGSLPHCVPGNALDIERVMGLVALLRAPCWGARLVSEPAAVAIEFDINPVPESEWVELINDRLLHHDPRRQELVEALQRVAGATLRYEQGGRIRLVLQCFSFPRVRVWMTEAAGKNTEATQAVFTSMGCVWVTTPEEATLIVSPSRLFAFHDNRCWLDFDAEPAQMAQQLLPVLRAQRHVRVICCLDFTTIQVRTLQSWLAETTDTLAQAETLRGLPWSWDVLLIRHGSAMAPFWHEWAKWRQQHPHVKIKGKCHLISDQQWPLPESLIAQAARAGMANILPFKDIKRLLMKG